jgi:hypothetical protein
MMRPYILIGVIPLALSGCFAEVLTTTAIEGELAARDAQASAQALSYAKESRAKIEAEQAIRAYQAETGSYPPSLVALVPSYLASVPVHADGRPYGYDPVTGQLLDGVSPAPPAARFTQVDQQNLEAIGQAIFDYWEATGLYPKTLDDLDPYYIARVPTTESGQPFDYDAQTGSVYPPANLQRPPVANAPVARGGGAGAGPLGETMTGIAIQNQLNNMNTSGASGTGSAARGHVRGIEDGYNARQNRALNQLDQ